MKPFLRLSTVLLAVTAVAAQPALTRTAARLTFGDAALAVELDANSGAWLAYRAGEQQLATGDAAFTPFDLGQDDQRLLADRHVAVTLASAEMRDGALVTGYRAGDWRVVMRWRLDSTRLLLVRSAEVTWQGTVPTKLKGVWFRTPPAPVAASGFFLSPGRYPPERRTASDFAAGGSRWFGGSLAPLVAQVAPQRSLVWLADELTAASDHASGTVTESAGAVQVSQRCEAMARMQPGATQAVGDAHLWLQTCDGETALRRLHTWMKWCGHVIPADRSPWFPDTVLYSFHPGGTIGSGFHDLGGFGPATAALDRIADLGCNALWLLPLEDRSPYLPRDYYRFAAGLGTADHYRALVARAHALGLHVLQDCVPHGGTNTNDRAKAHPEWLVQTEAGGTLDYWCFDFNSPTWQDYMAGVARHYVRDFAVDGYRVDAVGGSKIDNWNPQLPYARASFAKLQGGLHMLRSLRGAVKQLKPDGGLLAEVQGSVYGTAADAVYDFTGCYTVFQDLRRQPADVFVARLRRWLHEQDCAETEGLLRLRHTESHDSLRASQWYGTDGARALLALTAWIPGIPLVYHEGEEGNRDAFRQIFAIRRAAPELARGDADYLAVAAPATVFACLRRLGDQASVVLVNFGSSAVHATVAVPLAALPASLHRPQVRDLAQGGAVTAQVARETLTLPLDLAPLGYTVLALRAAAAPVVAPAPPAAATGRVTAEIDPTSGFLRAVSVDGRSVAGPMDVVLPPDRAKLGPPAVRTAGTVTTVERPAGDGKLVLRYETDDAGVSLRARWEGPQQPSYAAVLLPVAGAQRWSAAAADGRLADSYAVRHQPGGGTGFVGGIYWRPQGTDVLYDSLLHPLVLGGAGLAAEAAGKGLALDFPDAAPVRAQWLDRLGTRAQLCALLAWRDPAVPGEPAAALAVELRSPRPAPPAPAPVAQLKSVAGGWQFENGVYRLELGRTGVIRRLVRKGQPEVVVVERQDLYTDHGFASERTRYGAADDNEAGCRVQRDGETWRLTFEGQLRGFERFDLLRQPIDYRLEYTLSAAASFRLTAAARPTTGAGGPSAFLALQVPLPAMAGVAQQRGGATLTEGAIPPHGRVAETARLTPPAAPDAVTVRSAAGPLLRLDQLQWTGPRAANVFADGQTLYLAWVDGKPAGDEAQWLACSGLWTVGGLAPQPVGVVPVFAAPGPPATLLRDPSFEDDGEGTAQSVLGGEFLHRAARRSSWLAPPDGSLVTQPVHGGRCAAQVSSTSGSYLLWRQSLDLGSLPAGTRWRLSAWVKGREIVRGDVSWKVGTVRFQVSGAQTEYVAAPELLGTFDWRRVSVDLSVPAGLKGLEVQAGLNGSTGTLWVDDVTLERLPAP